MEKTEEKLHGAMTIGACKCSTLETPQSQVHGARHPELILLELSPYPEAMLPRSDIPIRRANYRNFQCSTRRRMFGAGDRRSVPLWGRQERELVRTKQDIGEIQCVMNRWDEQRRSE